MSSYKKNSLLLLIVISALQAYAQKFSVSFTPAASNESFSGKVLLYLSKDSRSPKDEMAGVERFPCFSITVYNIKPNEKVVFDDKAVSYPVKLSDIERGVYNAQVVWDKDKGGRSIANSPGNIYNDAIAVHLTKSTNAIFSITCNNIVKEKSFAETQFVKELKVPSALLTASYKRPTTINAAILLPKEYYEQPARRFPVLYWISGYGGDYHNYSGSNEPAMPIDTTPCIRVFLDGNCSLGHCVYANSDNNGPWGDALTQELIPQVEKTYRTGKVRLLTGHSSGGWTVLWLQTHYPEVFDACWSSSPDPVDFRSFQQVNLYEDKNIFYAKDSSLRPAGTIAGRFPWITMKNMYAMEHVIYRGEQMHSFDAVFSTKNSDGSPRRLCNESTGEIDPITVEHWKNYDISLYVRTNWQRLEPDLKGKIRVSVGNQDNFLLNYAVHLFDTEMKKINAGFVFAYYPGDHFTVSTPEYKTAGYQFLEQKYNEINNK
ncbi:MAG TPA: alpha/beta hydrolase-fold protein [Chitinophagaceae bacterium]|nr:alpha/beta hydrolase-fold protein [Chitinophagaceae bacterium]